MTKAEQKKRTIEDIAIRVSESAYMADAFSTGAYRVIARFLLGEEGFAPAEVEAIMDSKHIRWAYDMEGSATGLAFKRYYAANAHTIRNDVTKWKADGALLFYIGRQAGARIATGAQS